MLSIAHNLSTLTKGLGLTKKKQVTKITKPILNNSIKTTPNISLNICCWNVRRGLVKREMEIVNLVNSQNLDVLFLVETDSTQIMEQKDYTLPGLKTFFHEKKSPNEKTRMICLIKEQELSNDTI